MTTKDLIQSDAKHEYIFFWGHSDKGGDITKACLSQWYDTSFMIDGDFYTSAEQYMMAEKARIMGDEETRAKILKCHDPAKVKALGRMVKGFSGAIWDKVKVDVVI